MECEPSDKTPVQCVNGPPNVPQDHVWETLDVLYQLLTNPFGEWRTPDNREIITMIQDWLTQDKSHQLESLIVPLIRNRETQEQSPTPEACSPAAEGKKEAPVTQGETKISHPVQIQRRDTEPWSSKDENSSPSTQWNNAGASKWKTSKNSNSNKSSVISMDLPLSGQLTHPNTIIQGSDVSGTTQEKEIPRDLLRFLHDILKVLDFRHSKNIFLKAVTFKDILFDADGAAAKDNRRLDVSDNDQKKQMHELRDLIWCRIEFSAENRKIEEDLIAWMDRKSANEVLRHPLFWRKNKRNRFIRDVGNVREAKMPHSIGKKLKGKIKKGFDQWKQKIPPSWKQDEKETEMLKTSPNHLLGLLRYIRNINEHRHDLNIDDLISCFPGLFEKTYLLAEEMRWVYTKKPVQQHFQPEYIWEN